MGKRYFCDYCNRSFIDDLDARKKHLNGTLHLRSKKLHYKQYKDLKTIVDEEIIKEECRRFRTTGECQFGENCNYTHYSKIELDKMKFQVKEEERLKNTHPNILKASVEQWLESKLNSNLPPTNPTSMFSHEISTMSNLPPSLLPPSDKDLSDINLTEWG